MKIKYFKPIIVFVLMQCLCLLFYDTLYSFSYSIIWKCRLGYNVSSIKPIISGDNILFERNEGNNTCCPDNVYIYCLNKDNGIPMWEKPLNIKYDLKTVRVYDWNVADDKLYFIIDNGELSLISLALKTKELLWKYKFDNCRNRQGYPLISSPIIISNEIYVGVKNELFIIDKDTGKLNLKIAIGSTEDSIAPQVVAKKYDLLYLIGLTNQRDKSLICINNEGSVLWTYRGIFNEIYFANTLISDENIIIWGLPNSKNQYKKNNYIICCLDITTGEELWQNNTLYIIENVFINEHQCYVSYYDNIENSKTICKIIFFNTTQGINEMSKTNFSGKIMTISNQYIYINDQQGNILIINNITKKLSYIIKSNISIETNVICENNKIYYQDNKYSYLLKLTTQEIDKNMIELTFKINSTLITINNNEKAIDIPPIYYSNRVLLYYSYIIEPLGGSVSWDAKNKKLTYILGDKTIELWVNNPTATVNGKQLQIDPNNPKVTPIIINGRTMVPVRFLAEALGCEVKWIANTKTIILTYKP